MPSNIQAGAAPAQPVMPAQRLRSFLRLYLRNDSASTGIVFSLAAVPMMVMVGAGFDVSNAVRVRAELQHVADATALAVAKLMETGAPASSLGAYASSYVAATGASINAVVAAGQPVVDSQTGEVCLSANTTVETTMMKLMSIQSMALTSKSCAMVSAGTYEIALVLDTTGSMGNSDNNGQSKLTSMKNAANTFIDTLYDSASLGSRVKMSVVPFAPSVNVGTGYASASWTDTAGQSTWHWKSPMFAADNSIATDRFALFNLLKSQKSSWSWGGCVESLPYPYNISDDGPTPANPDTLLVPMLAPDEPANVTHSEPYYSGGRWRTRTVTDASYNNSYVGDKGSCATNAPTDNSTASQTTAQSRLCKYKNATNMSSSKGPNEFCTSKPLVRLQSVKTSLKTTVSSLSASGTTNIHEGFMWGWRTISPNAPFADGRAYSEAQNVKAIVLMTDGQNTWYEAANALNGSDYSAYGYYTSANGRLPSANQNVGNETEARNAMDALVRQSCDAAKAKQVVIYTIAFSVNSDPMDDQAKQLLQYCASSSEKYFAPNSQQTLSAAFTQIGSSLGQLRLSR